MGVFFSPASVPSESTKHVDVGKAICLPPPSSGSNAEATHYRKLAESKSQRLQCRRSLCQEALNFFLVCFRLHLEKHRGGVHATQCVCEMTTERYLAFNCKKLGFLEQQTTVSSFFPQVLFQTGDAPTWVSRVQIKTRRIALWTVTRDTGGTRSVLWEVTMYGHLPFTSTLPLSTLWDEQCSNLSLDDPNPMKNTQNSPKRRQEKQRLALRKHWNHYAGDGPAAAGCPVSNPDNIVDPICFTQNFEQLLTKNLW